ncbi:hypothetical protein AL050_23345 [Pseudomonas syringae pv. daphniphylli]|nr:hypothetical protein AL050_23345 [Pseudomonas syringae pv. daphniphylli]
MIKRYPLANQVGIDAVAQGNTGHRHAGLQAFLDYLGLERFGIRGSLAHGNPDDKGDGVHVFLGGEHRPYCWGRVGALPGRLQINDAFGRMLKGDVKYRFVIDNATLAG